MTSTAIILILCSAFLHAGWNLITKKQNPSGAFFLVGHILVFLCAIPVLIYFRTNIELIPHSVWMLLMATGFFNAIYYFSLAWAYRNGDLTIAYPLAKSLPTIFLTLLAFATGKGHEIGSIAIMGIGLIVVGCTILPMRQFNEFDPRKYLNLCCLLAGVAAAGTAGYTLVDKEAMSILSHMEGSPFTTFQAALIYLLLLLSISTLWLIVGVFTFKTERMHFKEIVKNSKFNALLMGLGMYLAYILILIAMVFVQNVSYVSAFRQTCILIGTIFGVTLLKEKAYAPKLTGIVIVFVGLILVAIG
jgi:drug/metabolite transporter (DMT)-like permease